MNTVQKIQSAIESLTRAEYMHLLSWIHERDWAAWDKQFEQDVIAGKLDFLAREAMEEKSKGILRDL